MSSSSSFNKESTMKLCIISIDFHMMYAHKEMDWMKSQFSDTPLKKVPVIQVFGSFPNGDKACLHVHHIFPYFYVLYEDSLETVELTEHKKVNEFAYQFGISINDVFKKHSVYTLEEDAIIAIIPVKGIPFYGYHDKPQCFLKLVIRDPKSISLLVDLLQSGSVMGRSFQAYEQHIPYLHQFFIDYNLYGMDYIEFENVIWRDYEPRWVHLDGNRLKIRHWGKSLRIEKLSRCRIEGDSWASSIKNRKKIKECTGRPEKPSTGEQLVPSLASLWEDENKRRSSQSIEQLKMTQYKQDHSRGWPVWNVEDHLWGIINDKLERNYNDHNSEGSNDDSEDLFKRDWKNSDSYRTMLDQLHSAWHAVDVVEILKKQSSPFSEQFRKQFSPLVDEELASQIMTQSSPLNSQKVLEKVDLPRTQDRMDNEILNILIEMAEDEFNSQKQDDIEDDTFQEWDSKLEIPDVQFSSSPMMERYDDIPDDDNNQENTMILDELELEFAETDTNMPQNHSDTSSIDNNSFIPQIDGIFDLPLSSQNKKSLYEKYFTRKINRMWSPDIDNNEDDINLDSKSIFREHPRPISPTKDNNDSPDTDESMDLSIVGRNVLEHIEMEIKNTTISSSIYGLYRPTLNPPSASHLSRQSDTLIPVKYKQPHYSRIEDVPSLPQIFAGKEYKFQHKPLSDFHCAHLPNNTIHDMQESAIKHHQGLWTSNRNPPTNKQAKAFQKQLDLKKKQELDTQLAKRRMLSQIEGPTQANTYGFKYTPLASDSNDVDTSRHFALISAEIHCSTREELHPDPTLDSIDAIFLSIKRPDSILSNSRQEDNNRLETSLLIVGRDYFSKQITVSALIFETEMQMLDYLITFIVEFDPDILTGYEIHNASWGYIIERCKLAYNLDFCEKISRMKTQPNKSSCFKNKGPSLGPTAISNKNEHEKEIDENNQEFENKDENIDNNNNTSNKGDDNADASLSHWVQTTLTSSGRIVLNVWRLMKSELALTSYTVENLAFHVLHQRLPKYTHKTLTKWYNHPVSHWKTIEYYSKRSQINFYILENTDFLKRTSEFARVYGVDFVSVINRGSQFKVESVMIRIAKPENYIMISPTRAQVASMRAPECIPLVMEPESRFYTSPLLVLDFQSLYPSIMIAYNYCFSTCLGRVERLDEKHKFGVRYDYELSLDVLERLKNDIHVSPNGLAFVKPHIREGVLKRMLIEILETRVMVKKSMSHYKNDKNLLRILEARQLSLKLLANVTYGYTGASFSGRMPCVDIADAIVQTGRETLEKAIQLIHSNTEKWGAQVVYGDTDSLFVYLPGVEHNKAFGIGQEIVDAVTMSNPFPIKLKFEKVYRPCVLLAKKRYVGFKFEHIHEKEPVFEAKGIETVRRDGCPVVAKMMEHSLKILFRSADLSQVKNYLYRQWTKIMNGHVSIQDFLIAKEVKLGSYSHRASTLPAGAMLSLNRMQSDPRAEPQYGERVPYLVIYGDPNARLIDQVITPADYLQNSSSVQLNSLYYITKQIIPALNRVFNLIGADLNLWFRDMPKNRKIKKFHKMVTASSRAGSSLIDHYYSNTSCQCCGNAIQGYSTSNTMTASEFTNRQNNIDDNNWMRKNKICMECAATPAETLYQMMTRKQKLESRYLAILNICSSCSVLKVNDEDGQVPCVSLDCSLFYEREKTKMEVLFLERNFILDN